MIEKICNETDITSNELIIKLLQKENEQLKEKLLVTQTNEETFRLEMENITKILGLDEDTIFDDVKSYARNLKNNMFEKEQLNNLVNSCQEEIRQLKKQLETYKKLGFKYLQDKNNNLETQQKEFIKWLEDEIQQQETVMAENQEKLYFFKYEDEKDDLKLSSQKAYIKRVILEEILKKYKSIIGVK